MITYCRYIDSIDHVWYDSSNIVYSKCYDTKDKPTRTVKIVFKQGRSYVYKDVDVNDYVRFKMSESTGKAFNDFIKKYSAVRIADTDLEKLNELQESFKNEIKENEEQKLGDLVYNIKVNEETGEFIIIMGERILFRGIEGHFSIVDLLASLNIKHTLEQVDELPNKSDEILDKIIVE